MGTWPSRRSALKLLASRVVIALGAANRDSHVIAPCGMEIFAVTHIINIKISTTPVADS